MKRGYYFGLFLMLAMLPFVIGELDSSQEYSQNFYLAIWIGSGAALILIIFFFFFFRKPKNKFKKQSLIIAPQKRIVHSRARR